MTTPITTPEYTRRVIAPTATAEPGADDRNLDMIEQGIASEARLDIRIIDVVRELGDHFDVLIVGVGTQALVALVAILVAQRVRIERYVADQVSDRRNDAHDSDGSCRRAIVRRRSTTALPPGGPASYHREADRVSRSGSSVTTGCSAAW